MSVICLRTFAFVDFSVSVAAALTARDCQQLNRIHRLQLLQRRVHDFLGDVAAAEPAEQSVQFVDRIAHGLVLRLTFLPQFELSLLFLLDFSSELRLSRQFRLPSFSASAFAFCSAFTRNASSFLFSFSRRSRSTSSSDFFDMRVDAGFGPLTFANNCKNESTESAANGSNA